MSLTDRLTGVLNRLRANEPIRLLIGERFYDASEIVPTAAWQAHLRAGLIADIEARLAEADSSDPDSRMPAAPAAIEIPASKGTA